LCFVGLFVFRDKRRQKKIFVCVQQSIDERPGGGERPKDRKWEMFQVVIVGGGGLVKDLEVDVKDNKTTSQSGKSFD
jgi:hypothetical protein